MQMIDNGLLPETRLIMHPIHPRRKGSMAPLQRNIASLKPEAQRSRGHQGRSHRSPHIQPESRGHADE